MKIIESLNNWTMKQPPLYGLFHIGFLLLMILTSILLVYHFRNSSEKVMKRIVLISWIILVVFEIAKQFIFSYRGDHLSYTWGDFPYQFCETPFYVMPLLLLTKNQKLKSAFISFLSTYALFAGLAIMIYPVTVLTTNVIISLRAFIQHGIQVVIGVYLYSWNRKNTTIEGFRYGVAVFTISVIIAIAINEILGAMILKKNMDMFFLSKNPNLGTLITKDIKPLFPWPLYVIGYVIGFTAIAFVVYYIETRVYSLWLKKHSSLEEKELEFKN